MKLVLLGLGITVFVLGTALFAAYWWHCVEKVFEQIEEDRLDGGG